MIFTNQPHLGVLYVDSNPQNLTQFRNNFEEHFDVYLASDEQYALDIIKDKQINLVITTQELPFSSGIELLRIVKITHPNIGRILITSGNSIDVLIDAIEISDVFRFLIKPYKKDELLKTINEHSYQQVDYSEQDVLTYLSQH